MLVPSLAKGPGLSQANTKNRGTSQCRVDASHACLFFCPPGETNASLGNWSLVSSRQPLTSIKAAILSLCHINLRFQTCLHDSWEGPSLLQRTSGERMYWKEPRPSRTQHIGGVREKGFSTGSLQDPGIGALRSCSCIVWSKQPFCLLLTAHRPDLVI